MTETKEIENTEESSVTLSELLLAMEAAEDHLEQFDPETLVGSVKDKVDAIHAVLSRMQLSSDYLKGMAKPYTAKAKAIENARERLREYVAHHMRGRFESLPGRSVKAVLKWGQEKIKVSHTAQPSALEYKRYAAFIKTEVQFVWDHDAIREAYLKGDPLPDTVSVVKEQASWVEFRSHTPEGLEPTKRGKKS